MRQILYILSFTLLFAGCAQVGPLSGGKRDTTPPKQLEAIPENNTVNFKGHKITIRFDEYIQVKDLSNQLIVSPFMKTPPEITASGKNLNIVFKPNEILPNTTYRLFFGNAIADMNESNAVPGLEYIFSTGPHIDTLRLKGHISEAFDNKPVPGNIVALYDEDKKHDSLPHTTKPDYYTRSNEQGDFSFRNLPEGTFQVFSFSDKNKNYLYDAGAEKVAFLDAPLHLISDSAIGLLQFSEEITKGFIKTTVSPVYGKTMLILNTKALVGLKPLNSADTANIYEDKRGMEKDTVVIYYKEINDTLKVILDNLSFNKRDTLQIGLPRSIRLTKKLKPFNTNVAAGKLPLRQNLVLRFPTWMDTGRKDLGRIMIKVSDSTEPLPALSGRWRDIATFEFDDVFKGNSTYTLQPDTGSFFDIYGTGNDTTSIIFKKESQPDFGKLTLKIVFQKKQAYIIQLLNDRKTVSREHYLSLSLSSSNAVSLDFTDIPPGTYFVKIIFDDNENKKWDTGHLLKRKQPEKVILHSKEMKIAADWEIEEEIKIMD